MVKGIRAGAGKQVLFSVCIFGFLVYLPGSVCPAVGSKVTRQASGADFLKGEAVDVVIGSQGTIGLGRSAEVVVEKFEGAWSINSVVVSGGAIFVGTSPNGGIYKYSIGELTKIYPEGVQGREEAKPEDDKAVDVNEPNDANTVRVERHLANEHIFAMASDISGRLLAGISGDKCRLCRLEAGSAVPGSAAASRMETIFEPNDAEDRPQTADPRPQTTGSGGTKYIFAIAIGKDGDIYLGTGPLGKVYKLDSFGRRPEVIYDSGDKNILSLAIGGDGSVYAGSDNRGLVYKIDPQTRTAAVLYDSEQEEVTALLSAEGGDLYAAATSAKIVQAQTDFAVRMPLAGRPEPQPQKDEGVDESEGGLKLKTANTRRQKADKSSEEPAARKASPPDKTSYIYRITKEGFVTKIFGEAAVFFCLAEQRGKLLVGTGNDARLFAVEPASEEQAIIYKDRRASQITAVVADGEDIYLGTANPAKLVKLAGSFARQGTYTSSLIDGGQPAKWGKLQIEADIPQGCGVKMACRSGNVNDVNDPTFSAWTGPVEVTEPVQLGCPLARFCQYKLFLYSQNGQKSPVVREVAVAGAIPNLAPRVEEIKVETVEGAGKEGVLKVSYKAKDDNEDKLIYELDFRKIGRTGWIEIEDKVEQDNFEWDTKTVEDGRYEVRVTASDQRSNTTQSSLSGSRVSEPLVVDNTGPVIGDCSITVNGKTVTLKFKASDELSAIGRVYYTVDSNKEWVGTMPEDSVYDTTDEDFTVVIGDLQDGEHIISIRASDAIGNMTYKSFEVEVRNPETGTQ